MPAIEASPRKGKSARTGLPWPIRSLCAVCGGPNLLWRRSHLFKKNTCSPGCARKITIANLGKYHFHPSGPENPHWKGGTRTHNAGYIERRVSGAGRTSRYVLEHRLVMQRVLGRPLDSWEHVHHKNGDKHDNRPENLELWIRPHPMTLRAVDEARRWMTFQ